MLCLPAIIGLVWDRCASPYRSYSKAPESYAALLLTSFLFAFLAGRGTDVLPGVKEAFFTRRDFAGSCLALTEAGVGAD